MTARFLFTLVAGLLLASASQAADGDPIESTNLGDYVMIGIRLCDDQGNGDCDEYDTHQVRHLGTPKVIRFSIEDDGTCTAGVVSPKGRDTTGDANNIYDLLTSDLSIAGGTVQAIINAPVNRYIYANVSALATCTDLDVRMYLYYEKGNRP